MEGPRPEQLPTLFRWFKEGPPGAIPVEHDGRGVGLLQAVGWEDAGDARLLGELARWHGPGFAARRWLAGEVLPAADRVLFWVKDVRGRAVGHVGLSRLDPANAAVTLSDVCCGDPAAEALVAAAVAALLGWVRHSLGLRARRQEERLDAAA